MTIDALGGGTALKSSIAGLIGPAREITRVQPPEPVEPPNPVEPPKPVEKDQEPYAAATEQAEISSEEEQAQDPKSITDLALSANEIVREQSATRLSILYDQDIDLFISRRVDPESGDVVRQFPYEEQIERIRIFADQNRRDTGARLDLSV